MRSTTVVLAATALSFVLAPGPVRGDDPPAGPAPAPEPQGEEQVLLRYRFDRLAGLEARYTIETEQRVRQELRQRSGARESGGGEVSSWTRETFRQAFARGARGQGQVELTSERLEARLEAADQREAYDSADPAQQPSARLAPLIEKLGRTVTLQVDPRGKVGSVRGCPVAQRPAYERVFLELPRRAITAGHGWDRLDPQPMPPLGTLNYHFKYRLAGVLPPGEDRPVKRYRIEATIRASYSGLGPDEHTHVELTRQGGTGYLILDADGLLLESVLESDLEITIKAPAGTQVQRIRSKTVQRLRDVGPRQEPAEDRAGKGAGARR